MNKPMTKKCSDIWYSIRELFRDNEYIFHCSENWVKIVRKILTEVPETTDFGDKKSNVSIEHDCNLKDYEFRIEVIKS